MGSATSWSNQDRLIINRYDSNSDDFEDDWQDLDIASGDCYVTIILGDYTSPFTNPNKWGRYPITSMGFLSSDENRIFQLGSVIENAGTWTYNNTGEKWHVLFEGPLMGDKGSKGAKGIVGKGGVIGNKGNKGADGKGGETGQKGAKGAIAEKAERGDSGKITDFRGIHSPDATGTTNTRWMVLQGPIFSSKSSPKKTATTSLANLLLKAPNCVQTIERGAFDGGSGTNKNWWPYRVDLTATLGGAIPSGNPGNTYVYVYKSTGPGTAWNQVGTGFTLSSAGWTSPETACYYQSDTMSSPVSGDTLDVGDQYGVALSYSSGSTTIGWR